MLDIGGSFAFADAGALHFEVVLISDIDLHGGNQLLVLENKIFVICLESICYCGKK